MTVAEDQAFLDALGLPGFEDDEKIPLVLVERAILQTWDLGVPYLVLPGMHVLACLTQGRSPRMPRVCGAEHWVESFDVTLVCMKPEGHDKPKPLHVQTGQTPDGRPIVGDTWHFVEVHGWEYAKAAKSFAA